MMRRGRRRRMTILFLLLLDFLNSGCCYYYTTAAAAAFPLPPLLLQPSSPPPLLLLLLLLPLLLQLVCPRGLTFMWWGCYVNVKDINQPSLPTSFYSVLVSVSLLWAFQLYFTPYILPTPLCFLTLFFRSYLCLIGLFNYNYVSYESLLQPWYNP